MLSPSPLRLSAAGTIGSSMGMRDELDGLATEHGAHAVVVSATAHLADEVLVVTSDSSCRRLLPRGGQELLGRPPVGG
jgi:hypothetical protein